MEEAPAGDMEEAPAVDDFKFLGKNCGTCGKRVLKLATSILLIHAHKMLMLVHNHS